MSRPRANGPSVSRARSRARGVRAWARLPDEALLQMRFCDLKLSIERSPLKRHVRALYADLERRGIALRPHVWLSQEWFSPDGVPGIAVPFYLAHPRLERLERRIMREAEGGNSRLLMRILRHEAGHALDNAYRLRRRRRWREVFGPASRPYPARYRARAGSRRYVHHLGEWYAQAHPTEDFAETFAVWLTPKSAWRRNYAGWPALHKLQAVDELVGDIRARRPPVRNRIRIEPLDEDTRTLAQHYRRKLAHNRQIRRGLADELLRRAFCATRTPRQPLRAATFLRARARLLERVTARALGIDPYSVEQVLHMLIERSERLGLYLRGSQRDAQRYARWMLERLTGLYAQGETPHLPL
ncbi:MAG TPA: putative zinc-binding metallopeptidase [Steroidobacteraceae bacterium]|nr:putative zinc-binding metallopeptidase [Steroidobacteraceae bacterium]